MQTFDIVKFSKRLRASGQFTHEQVDAFVGALVEGFELTESGRYEDREIHYLAPDGKFRKTPRNTEKNKTLAAVFALFLGFIGIHKFYLGRIGTGFLYLVFCWTFIPAFISFFESLALFSMTDEEFTAEYP
jgi:TM2 domain-containing membrane protein YozV